MIIKLILMIIINQNLKVEDLKEKINLLWQLSGEKINRILSEYDEDFEYIQKKIKSTSFELIFKNPLKSSLPPISRSKLLNLFLEIGKKGDKKPKLANSITINKNNLDVLKAIFGDYDIKLNVGESLNFNDSIIAEKLN